MDTEKILSEKLKKFKAEYPIMTSADMQAFILGFRSLEEALPEILMETKENSYFEGYQQGINDCAEGVKKLIKKI